MPAHDKILFYLFGRENPRVQRGTGYYYYDTNGKEYLDAVSGIFNCVLGHTAPERITRVLHEHTEKLNCSSFVYFQNDGADRLAEQLLALMPDYAAVGFFQSGSDALEAALQCAFQVGASRSGGRRTKIIGRHGGWHGTTSAGLALGNSDTARARDFRSFLHISAQDCFNCPYGLEYPACNVRCASALEALVEKEGPETIAAFVAEPSTQGGHVPDEYWPRVRAICDRYGILLVSDEVLEGMWRTGPAVALTRWGVTPDVVATGKVLGAGFMPIFGMLVTEAVRDTLAEAGSFWAGHTYSGHSLSCEVASAVLDEIEQRHLSSTGVEFVERQLNETLDKVCLRVDGASKSVRGALARVCIPCSATGDRMTFYREMQKLLQRSGLNAGIRRCEPTYIALALAPPFIADEEFFLELEARLNQFIDHLRARHPVVS